MYFDIRQRVQVYQNYNPMSHIKAQMCNISLQHLTTKATI